MIPYEGTNPGILTDLPNQTPQVREMLLTMDIFLHRVSDGMSLVDRGMVPTTGGGSLSSIGDHGELRGLADDDHLQYFLLAGRSGGQRGIGNPATATGATTLLDLLGFNNPPIAGVAGMSSRAAMLRLNDSVTVYAEAFRVFERSLDYVSAAGFEVNTGVGYANTSNYGSLTAYGMSAAAGAALYAQHNTAGNANNTVEILGKTGDAQTGHVLQIKRGHASATGDLIRLLSSAGAQLSGFNAAGNPYLIAGAAAGLPLISSAGGVGSWGAISAAALPSGIVAYPYSWVVNGPYNVDTSYDGAYVPNEAFTVVSVKLWRRVAGTSGSTIVALMKNGVQQTTLTVNQADGSNFTASAVVSIAVAANDKLTVDCTVKEAGSPLDFVFMIEGE